MRKGTLGEKWRWGENSHSCKCCCGARERNTLSVLPSAKTIWKAFGMGSWKMYFLELGKKHKGKTYRVISWINGQLGPMSHTFCDSKCQVANSYELELMGIQLACSDSQRAILRLLTHFTEFSVRSCFSCPQWLHTYLLYLWLTFFLSYYAHKGHLLHKTCTQDLFFR